MTGWLEEWLVNYDNSTSMFQKARLLVLSRKSQFSPVVYAPSPIDSFLTGFAQIEMDISAKLVDLLQKCIGSTESLIIFEDIQIDYRVELDSTVDFLLSLRRFALFVIASLI